MPSFRKAANQADRMIRRSLALKTKRHDNRDDGKIHSRGTARAYQQALTGASKWLKKKANNQALERMTVEQAHQYLDERRETVRQKTLDLDRQALQILPQIGKLDRIESRLDPSPLETGGRAYTPVQVQMVAAAQSERHALATEIAHAAGLRGHELLTLRRADEQAASTHRKWSAERFEGRPDNVRYTVVGKGGLVREVALSVYLSERLEERRWERPKTVTDRGIRYTQHYDFGGGLAWSRSFSAASKRALGWSTGGHGLRHSYAQERIEDLQQDGHTYDSALGLVSQEMGHFRGDITEVYLR